MSIKNLVIMRWKNFSIIWTWRDMIHAIYVSLGISVYSVHILL